MKWLAQRQVLLALVMVGLGLVLVVAGCSNRGGRTQPVAAALVFRHSGVALPADFRQTFIKYAVIERRDGTIRDLYINPESADAFEAGRALPDQTTIIVEAFQAQRDADGGLIYTEDGRFLRGEPFAMLHVAQKRATWQDGDFVSEVRAGDWNFGSFDGTTGDYFNEDLTLCFHCHRPAGNSDFVYSYGQLLDYSYRHTPQYSYCELTGRSPCNR